MNRQNGTLLALLAALAAQPAAQERPVFRATADSVAVEVSVLDGRRPVAGLTADDFELFDNGVRQSLLHVDRSTLPLDVTLVADLSSSMVDGWTGGLIWARHGDAEPWLRDGLNGIASMLRPEDRFRLIEFGSRVRVSAGAHLPSGVLGTDAKSTRSSVLDAVTLALVQRVEPDRRRLVIVMTDGHDTSSLSDAETRRRVMARSDAVVNVVAIGTRSGATIGEPAEVLSRAPSPLRDVRSRGASRTLWNLPIGNYDWVFNDIARRTGGRFLVTDEASDFLPELSQMIEEFRSRYVLRYVPTGVDGPGWHEVGVRLLEGRGWSVEARQGYLVGG